MKILYIITKSEAGGAQTHVFQLSRYMAEKGSEVAVMAYPGGWLENELRIKNKELGIEFYPNKYFKNSYNPLLGLKAMKEVKKAVQDFQPDIVSCHSTVAGFWTRLALRRFVRQGKPFVIFTAHGWGFTQGVFWFRRKLLPLAEKIASRYCKKIICVSEYDRQLALKYKIAPKEKLVTIYNGVEIQSTTNYQLPTINNREPRIVFVGRLAEPKQPELLLEAFNELLDDVKKRAQVAIIGDGPKREKLEKIVKEKSLQNKVKLLGGLTREKVFEVLRKSDIFSSFSLLRPSPIIAT